MCSVAIWIDIRILSALSNLGVLLMEPEKLIVRTEKHIAGQAFQDAVSAEVLFHQIG